MSATLTHDLILTQARAHIEAVDYSTWHREWIARYEAGAAARVAGSS